METANTDEQRRKRDYELIQELCLMDDRFMSKVFESKPCAQQLLQIVLQRDDLTVTASETQYDLKNLQGRSVRLDIYAMDADGKRYNVEVQRADEGANPKRARYNSSLIDANITEPGDDLAKLPETYVIFITEHDVIGDGKPLYHIERVIVESNYRLFGDEAHMIYVNSEIQDDTPLGRLMHDFYCKKPSEMYYAALRERTKDLKETAKGVDEMRGVLEQIREESLQEGILKGMQQGMQQGLQQGMMKGIQEGMFLSRQENARMMLAEGSLSPETVARFSGLTLAEVRSLAEKLGSGFGSIPQ